MGKPYYFRSKKIEELWNLYERLKAQLPSRDFSFSTEELAAFISEFEAIVNKIDDIADEARQYVHSAKYDGWANAEEREESDEAMLLIEQIGYGRYHAAIVTFKAEYAVQVKNDETLTKYDELGYSLDLDDDYNWYYVKDGKKHIVKENAKGEIAQPSTSLRKETGKTKEQTASAAEANKKDVWIDGKHYNSYQEAAEATGMSTKTIQRSIDDGKSHKGHTISSTGPATQNYWENRAAADQQLIDRNELGAEKAVQQIQHDTYEKMAAELNEFYAKMEDGYVPTRSELMRMEQYQSLCAGIKENMDDATKSSLSVIQGSLEETAATKMVGYDKFGIEAVANTQYKGEFYSDRVWNNSNAAAAKIQEKVTDCIVTGESLDKAKQELKELCNNNTYNAMRVLRTETARVQNKAEEAMYKSAGIKQVEILVEPDACELCSQYKGKTFVLGHQPTLPIHPNCRCDLLPVVE